VEASRIKRTQMHLQSKQKIQWNVNQEMKSSQTADQELLRADVVEGKDRKWHRFKGNHRYHMYQLLKVKPFQGDHQE
jgi:hypothetical protein